ncbi:type II toxin-antitoxin system death-on-curing family toxin [Staphylococcus americanisciuri]|uniref:Type II toxin-antitoxin system death-on-curing family toxin n=1 Tax=Staphylococcus americanisciuri TaxID=2973940 RepID=A0ABT2F037_9STAP|nr:type II toxin-antitoxin system death-on-curing family toxin [Staphylococcus americanisciuri]MCS4485811.1 type II toxin-antitoxin system death-on-curing family toxin [Staphylococcus americanisciuri]
MKYLKAEDIVKINIMVIGEYSPIEPVGISNISSLNMIVNQPKQEVFGRMLYPDIYSKAAILWINIIKKHPFYNGNKRTAFIAMHMFLSLNGYQSNIDRDEGFSKTIDIVTFQGDFELLKDNVVDFLKKERRVYRAK